jgi:hypothetical protein
MMNSKRIAICLLVVAATISSTLLMIFHQKYDRPLLMQTMSSTINNRRHRRHQHLLSDFFHNPSSSSIILPSVKSDQQFGYTRRCFPYNSKRWLESERLGNQLFEPLTTNQDHGHDYVVTTVLKIDSLFSDDDSNNKNLGQRLLRQTICHKESKLLSSSSLLNDAKSTLDGNDLIAVRYLALRLMYYAIHIHQHRHAVKEARIRYQNDKGNNKEIPCQRMIEGGHYNSTIGRFDFECPDARFLVVPMKQRGLGAIIRTDVTTAFMAGVASDRVVLFVNGVRTIEVPEYIQSPWQWSSCPRRDKQCFFLPDSPCVLTKEELINGTVLEKSERRKLFKTGQLPHSIRDRRVVVMNMFTRPQRTPLNFYDRVTQIIKTHIVQPIKEKNPNDERLPMISTAIDYILDNKDDNINYTSFFSYFGRDSLAHHAMVFYAMRPNFDYSQRLDDIMNRAFKEHEPASSLRLGLPIRASDKCIDEAECPAFDQYMELMETIWESNNIEFRASQREGLTNDHEWTNKNISIILTSESPDVFLEKKEFENKNNLVFPLSSDSTQYNFVNGTPFHFITNEFDVMQGSGNPTKLPDVPEVKEDILLSTIASLKMQMHAKLTVGNCCSNHHLLLFDFLQEGCGEYSENTGKCMQDNEDPKFRLCCGWSKSEACLAKRKIREDIREDKANMKE